MQEVSRTTTPETPNALITLTAAAEILGTKPWSVHRLCEAGELSVYSIPNSPAWMVLSAEVEAFAQAVREGRKTLADPDRWNGVHEPWCNNHQGFGEDDTWCCSAETTIGGVTAYLSQYDRAKVEVALRDGNDDEEAHRSLDLDVVEALGSELLRLHRQATSPKLAGV
jgi:hypothetical protein